MNELEQYKERLRIALKAAKISVFEVDLTRQLYTFFENAEAIFGVPGEVILREVQPFSRLEPENYRREVSAFFSHPDDEDTIKAAFSCVLNGQSTTYEARMKAGNSDYVWCRIHAVPVMEDGRPVRMIGVVTDIAELKARAECFERAANLDGFTGLYNKKHAIAMMEEALRCEPRLCHALIVLDIDDFKRFNDAFGHDQGDGMLQEVARRIKAAWGEESIAGRFGGDEFILLVRDVANVPWLRGKLKDLLRFESDGRTCTASIGVALCPRDGREFAELFKKADRALYRAKAKKEEIIFCMEGPDS